MKANEAPEKIYRTTFYLDDDKGDTKWKKTPVAGAENIEYVRTDAFIEKAISWLKNHSEMDYFELIPDANYCGAGTLNEKRMIDDFRKYMEE